MDASIRCVLPHLSPLTENVQVAGEQQEQDGWPTHLYVFPTSRPYEAFRSDLNCLALRSSPNLSDGSTGCKQWTAGCRLAEFVMNNPTRFAGAQAPP